MAAVNAVFTCTQRKTGGIPAANSIARFAGAAKERARKWTSHLDRERKNGVPAREVYCGEHWDAVRGLFGGVGQSQSVWVTSAGYGLISADAPIVPYSATFSAGQPDSVADDVEGAASWWTTLSDWQGPIRGAPRSFRDLAASAPKTPLLVAAAPPYLRAFAADLEAAKAELSNPDLLVVVTSKTRLPESLSENVVWSDARLRGHFGGSCVSLNARLLVDAVSFLDKKSLRASILRPHYSALINTLEDLVTEDRKAVDDDKVRDFIRAELKANANARHSPLLRKLRTEMKLQCEQKRFRDLFLEVKGLGHGS